MVLIFHPAGEVFECPLECSQLGSNLTIGVLWKQIPLVNNSRTFSKKKQSAFLLAQGVNEGQIFAPGGVTPRVRHRNTCLRNVLSSVCGRH